MMTILKKYNYDGIILINKLIYIITLNNCIYKYKKMNNISIMIIKYVIYKKMNILYIHV